MMGVKKNTALDSENVPNELEGCYHVYLDCGSNRGVQVQKLYEPELYPDVPVNTFFKKIFGKVAKRREVCSVGFEPNAKHTEYLKRIESSYNKCGYRTFFKVPTGLADYDGEGSYFSDNSKEFYEWGGGVIEKRVTSKANTGKVEIIRLVKYIKDIVNTRDTGASEQDLLSYNPPRVMMKIDIEGSEKDVLIDMALSGTLEIIDFAFIEYHDDHLTDPADRQKTEDARMVANTLSKYSKYDETYGLSDEPLPKC
ncbi:hypothetical protein SARC_02028 [Sphaeroforma arctica JP610]|uniref:Methyltransferase FkbM domain-containing protein n=1 Tax=Sphaeroforma arctica JP610 TaxID=667725 RepID=A0A0L0GC22_9EUKA|nr:hypothetical protein SARC_02028 [Sphaeroforma arctica JP610]KNC85803.1 hypothetical protein SARC_02028 [Sphaeroforma arctica JP610]|eukprot:XP_014159705.1 hypothetical protein SARC_02028 [Sphaeroforma arctica JP610]